MSFANKTVVLTGATGGIGQAIAQLLAGKGATLLLVARNEDSLIDLSAKLGGGQHYLAADVSTGQGREAIIDRARQLKADILINNAGISQFDAIHNISEDQFRQAMEVNLLAPMCLTRDFLALNTGYNKTVMNVGSALGSIGFPFYSSYCASKFGLRGFSEALSRELAQSNDSILYFAPRATQTPMNTEAVNAMNRQFGNAVDSPQVVAYALVNQLEKGNRRAGIGWPEQIFAKVNALLPRLVDSVLSKKLKNISQHVRSH